VVIAGVLAAVATLVVASAFGRLFAGRRAAGRIAELERELHRARELADLDSLTALHNRRFFHDALAREVARAHRYERALALIVLDLDDFKAINDRVGHLGGDAVLADTAACIREVVRATDIACRVGGDELAIILPESTAADAERLYHRLREGLASRAVGGVGPVSVSAGVAEVLPKDDSLVFFARADDALYRAKAGGKGQIAASWR
jgi:diguanylate cyclase (GGDEF)-like protein